jgi:hypothetical protein
MTQPQADPPNWCRMTSPLIADIEQRLRAAKFEVVRNVQLPGGSTAALAASRAHFSWKGLVILSQHVVVAEIENATVGSVETLFDASFGYAKRVNKIPLPRGFQFGYSVIPTIITKNPSAELIAYVTKSPRKHFALFELPVVIDATSGAVNYFHGRPLWGFLYFSDMRAIVEKYIEGKSG